ncbi:MAG: DUF3822 family protein [Saprospiraceae bacterium]|nr:DUF3822 family protein [Saprospiraceae bacterium]
MTPQLATSSAMRMVVGLHGVSLVAKNDSGMLALKSWQLLGTEQGFQSIESALRQVFGSERLLELSFNSKLCALSSAASTLVPRRLFDPHNLEQYFKLLLRAGEERTYGYEKLEAFDCYLVWAAETSLTRLCGQYFPSENIHHLAASLLRAYHAMAPIDGYAVYANLRGQQVQVFVFERRNLVFFNTFNFAKPADLLYYILLAYKQFDLDPLVIPLTLSGTLEEDSDIFRLLLRYVRPMRFPPLPTGFQVPDGAKSIPAHYWFDLASV